MDGRTCYRDTGRPVDEDHGTHVVIGDIYDVEAYAVSLEAEADAGSFSAAGLRSTAGLVRAWGPHTQWITGTWHDAATAEAYAADCQKNHPHPGVRYSVAPIDHVSHCVHCFEPVIAASGELRHDLPTWPYECSDSDDMDQVATAATA
jgi:hypothetical protein